MAKIYYLAVDIGASSGRHMLAWKEDGRMKLVEVHRFANGMKKIEGALCWDLEHLYREILTGLKKCGEMGKQPSYMGIDTWGVDFVLLDAAGNRVGKAVGYRDSRTKGIDQEVFKVISKEKLYQRSGIQKQDFNTIYQLMAIQKNEPELLERAEHLLMIPDYLNYLLTGVMLNEYTEATTGQLVSPITKDWDFELLELLGFPRRLFGKIAVPGTAVGRFTETVQNEVGYNLTVVLPAAHDTGSAVLAVPSAKEPVLYISSGTWSLIGTEQRQADCSPESMAINFTNEGGYDYRFRYLKNIMGLWMIQSVRKELSPELSFGEICEMASVQQISSLVNCNDDCFLAPDSMTAAVRDYCRRTGQEEPETTGEIAAVIYNSLAVCYQHAVAEIEAQTGVQYDCIHIIGGGANASYLNKLTAKYTGKTVYAGPTEATAVGNIIVQMLYSGEYSDLTDARTSVALSFAIEKME